MTRDVAIRKIMKLLGPKAGWRVESGVSSPEKRARYHERLRAARDARTQASAALSARAAELAAADAEYQRLKTVYQKAVEAAKDTRYRDDEGGYKFTVGKNVGIGFWVEAQGDTWEEVFTKLERKAS